MSRIGKKPIKLPKSVKISVQDHTVKVEGPRGQLQWQLPQGVVLQITKEADGETVVVQAPAPMRGNHGFQGLARAVLFNMCTGVTTGFSRDLELVGVGYKAEVKAGKLVMALGYSHLVEEPIPEGIKVTFDKNNTKMSISGNDRQGVGDFAAKVHGFREPEPYKGKGIRYSNETILRKAGKTGSK